MQIGAADWYFVISEFGRLQRCEEYLQTLSKSTDTLQWKIPPLYITSHQFQNNLSKSCFGKRLKPSPRLKRKSELFQLKETCTDWS